LTRVLTGKHRICPASNGFSSSGADPPHDGILKSEMLPEAVPVEPRQAEWLDRRKKFVKGLPYSFWVSNPRKVLQETRNRGMFRNKQQRVLEN
jgi:hypothetical protein